MDATSLLLPLIILLPLALLIMRQRKQQREYQTQQARVAVGQQVMTTAGMYGTVIEIHDDQMVLEIAPGIQVRWAKAAVGKILTDGLEPVVDPAVQTPPGTEGPDLTKPGSA